MWVAAISNIGSNLLTKHALTLITGGKFFCMSSISYSHWPNLPCLCRRSVMSTFGTSLTNQPTPGFAVCELHCPILNLLTNSLLYFQVGELLLCLVSFQFAYQACSWLCRKWATIIVSKFYSLHYLPLQYVSYYHCCHYFELSLWSPWLVGCEWLLCIMIFITDLPYIWHRR